MGKGQIVSGGESGRYQVKLIYAYRNRVTSRLAGYTQQIALLDQKITAIDAQIAVEADPVKKAKLQDTRSVMVLQRASTQKLHDYYSTKMPADPTVDAWCADKTENLAAGTNVGTIEIPGEPSTVLIRPAYDNRSVYTAARDGNLMPSVAGSPHQVLFNWMLLPGWQRHKPIYRAGTIVPDSLDFDNNTCSVCLDPAYSSQQSLPAVDGLGVGDCNMGDDDQSQYLTESGEDFCSRNPGHPFCTQSPGSEINITDAQLAQLQNVNYLVNGAHGRANDPSGIGVGDRWDVMGTGDSGDCEDFALTKMQMLVDTYGWNPNSLNLVTAFAKNGEYHAMLGVRTKNRGLVILDVNYDEVMESGRVPYRIDKIALASDDWKNYARRLDNVPIEYMRCNAEAFADEDRVVVEFAGQSWTSPKVVGFYENPKSCMLGYVAISQYYDWYFDQHVVWWDDIGQALVLLQTIEAGTDQLISDSALASSKLRAIRFSGIIQYKSEMSWNEQPLAFYVKTNTIENRQQQNINAKMLASYQQNGSAYSALGNGEINTLWQSYNSESEKYTYDTDAWNFVRDPGYVGLYANAFSISGTSYLIGGETYSGNLGDSNSYNSIENTWSTINDGGMKLCRHAAFSALGKGYCMLGYDDNGSGERVDLGHYSGFPPTYENILYSYPNDPLREYDPLTDSWSNKTMGTDGSSIRQDGNDGQEGYGYIVGDIAPGEGSFLDIYIAALDYWTFTGTPDIYLWNPLACSLSE